MRICSSSPRLLLAVIKHRMILLLSKQQTIKRRRQSPDVLSSENFESREEIAASASDAPGRMESSIPPGESDRPELRVGSWRPPGISVRAGGRLGWALRNVERLR